MRLLLPLILALLGAGAGIGAGLFLAPAPPEAAEAPDNAREGDEELEGMAALEAAAGEGEELERPDIADVDFVRLNNQFIVPVLEEGRVRALVVLTLGLETRAGLRPTVYAREPKLRDAFLSVMFDHANAGGFDEAFTASGRLDVLRRNLREAARPVLGPDVYDVLITDIARQDG